MEKFQHWLQEPSLHDTIQDAIKRIKINNFHLY